MATSANGQLRVTVERERDCVRCHLSGELDLATAPFLREKLQEAVGMARTEPLVLDISELGYVDSTGLSLFVATKKRADREGRRFELSHPTADFLRLAEVAGLTEYFDLVT
jgi:anti-sigma B factor antagonist